MSYCVNGGSGAPDPDVEGEMRRANCGYVIGVEPLVRDGVGKVGEVT